VKDKYLAIITMIKNQISIPEFLISLLVTCTITTVLSPVIVDVQAETTKMSKTERSFSSEKVTENDNAISNQTIIKQGEDTLNENFTIYEGLGIKLENFTPWTILAKSDKSTCYNVNLCYLHLGIVNETNIPETWILQDNFESQTIKEYCNCNILEDYVNYFYTTMISQTDNFSFLNKTQTTLSGERIAIQLEYEFSPANTNIRAFTIFTKDGDSFYQFIYYADPEFFSKNFSNFQKLIEIIEFASQKNYKN
jgi:hypothetical protein